MSTKRRINNEHFENSGGGALASARIPPHSREAEESVLGGILLDNEAINNALEIVSAADFYGAANKAIFSAMTALSDHREPIDVVSVSQQLRSMGLLEQSGGIENLARLASLVPSAANIAYYAKLVKEMGLRRRVIHEASEIIGQAFSLDEGVENFLDATEQRILAVSDRRIRSSFHKVGDLVQDSIRLVEQLYDKKELVTGTPTGFAKLDHMTAGFQPSDLIIIAARPAMGKTALALSMAQWVGIHKKHNVAVFSLEMSKEQLVLRMLCSEARVNNSKVRTGHLAERDFPRLVDAASHIAEAKIFIDDTPSLAVTEMRAKCRRLHREHPLSLIIVDYLQLMRSPAYSHSREQEIADISRTLKAVAKELNVPVIALSQLNRSVESRTDKRPLMSDLRESGAIEQDADIIMFIYRDEVYNPETIDKGVAELIIAKQRTGPTGVVRLAFSPEFTRFDTLEEQVMESSEQSDFQIDAGLISDIEIEPF
ncbi:MAG: replicative DNA helicase [Deltaproteobacteria bacterium]|nr:replicative DNA helicase [Deltaproteobacteria bacterium]